MEVPSLEQVQARELNDLRQEVYGMRHELDNADRIIGQLQRQHANQQQLIGQLTEELRARDAARDKQPADEQPTEIKEP